MSDNVISYIEMCRRERMSLQAGMNFGLDEAVLKGNEMTLNKGIDERFSSTN